MMKKGIAIALGIATVTGLALAFMYKRVIDELETGMNMTDEDCDCCDCSASGEEFISEE